MKDYLKLAAIVAIFLLGSASDSFANPNNWQNQQTFNHQVRQHQVYQQQARQQAAWGNQQLQNHQQQYVNRQVQDMGYRHGQAIRRWFTGGK